MRAERTCIECGAVYKIWEYGVIFAPRTDETHGWVKVQCPKCWSVGGIAREERALRDELERLIKEKETIRMKIGELNKVLKSIERNTIMEQQ